MMSSKLLSLFYNSDFSLPEDESSCDEEEVYAYPGPRVIAAGEVAALSRAVTSEQSFHFRAEFSLLSL